MNYDRIEAKIINGKMVSVPVKETDEVDTMAESTKKATIDKADMVRDLGDGIKFFELQKQKLEEQITELEGKIDECDKVISAKKKRLEEFLHDE